MKNFTNYYKKGGHDNNTNGRPKKKGGTKVTSFNLASKSPLYIIHLANVLP